MERSRNLVDGDNLTTWSVAPLEDAGPHAADGAWLRHRMRHDSGLRFAGLLPRGRVLALRAAMLDRLGAIGWLAPGHPHGEAVPGADRHHDRGRLHGAPIADPGWSEGYQAVQRLEALHELAHEPSLVAVMQLLLDSDVLVHPRKIARIAFPDTFATPPHQDAVFNKTPVDVLTTWIPLGDYGADTHGTLRVLEGSARGGVRPEAAADGLGGDAVAIVPGERWRGGPVRAGDVLVFHARTVHTVPGNRADRLRLSVDFRYQRAAEPVKTAALLPHGFGAGVLPSWSTLAEGWSSTRWIELDRPVRITNAPAVDRSPSPLLDGPRR